jgi:hypothetical protein
VGIGVGLDGKWVRMRKAGWLALASVLAAACTQHPPGWDDAWAECEAQSIEAVEAADADRDQRSEYMDSYIDQCMNKKGFKVKTTIWS